MSLCHITQPNTSPHARRYTIHSITGHRYLSLHNRDRSLQRLSSLSCSPTSNSPILTWMNEDHVRFIQTRLQYLYMCCSACNTWTGNFLLTNFYKTCPFQSYCKAVVLNALFRSVQRNWGAIIHGTIIRNDQNRIPKNSSASLGFYVWS